MASLEPKPIPRKIFFCSTLFAVIALMVSAIPWSVKITLIFLTMAYGYGQYYLMKKNTWVRITYVEATQKWLLQNQQGKIEEATLLASSYLGQYVMMLHWRHEKSSYSLFFRWQFNEEMWRQMRVMLLS